MILLSNRSKNVRKISDQEGKVRLEEMVKAIHVSEEIGQMIDQEEMMTDSQENFAQLEQVKTRKEEVVSMIVGLDSDQVLTQEVTDLDPTQEVTDHPLVQEVTLVMEIGEAHSHHAVAHLMEIEQKEDLLVMGQEVASEEEVTDRHSVVATDAEVHQDLLEEIDKIVFFFTN